MTIQSPYSLPSPMPSCIFVHIITALLPTTIGTTINNKNEYHNHNHHNHVLITISEQPHSTTLSHHTHTYSIPMSSEPMSQRELMALQQQALCLKQEALESEHRALDLAQRALESREKQFEMDMKQQRADFEAKMKQQQVEWDAKMREQQVEMEEQFKRREEQLKQQFLLPDPTTSLLLSSTAVGGSNSGHVNHNTVNIIQSQQSLKKEQQPLVNNNHNNNQQQISQLKKIASMTQNRYDDTLRLLDQVKRQREALELERVQFATSIEHEKDVLEQRRVEIESMANIGAQAKDTIIKRSYHIATIQSLEINHEGLLLSLITMSDDEFDKWTKPQNHRRLKDFIKFTLTPFQCQHMFGLSNTDYNDLKGRIPIFEWSSQTGPPSVTGKMVISDDTPFFQTQQQFLSSELYNSFVTSTVVRVITSCKRNFDQWGMSEDTVRIEFKLIPIKMNFHYYSQCFYSLLGMLYPMNGSTPIADGYESLHIHPKNPSLTESDYPIFNNYYSPLLANGEIPKLSTNTRLYFSTPHIANGDWIQFHGPGTKIFYVGGKNFYLTIGALCPKGKEGVFTSRDTYYNMDDKADQPNYSESRTSQYQISIKWD